MITTGWNGFGYVSKTEVIELTADGSTQCKDWNGIMIEGTATGGLIGNTPFICVKGSKYPCRLMIANILFLNH